MRDIRKGNCPLCGYHIVVRAYQPDWGDGNFEHPASVTAAPRFLLSGRQPGATYGHLAIYFCRSCGFAQEFVEDPKTVPIGDDYRTKLIKGVKQEGYR